MTGQSFSKLPAGPWKCEEAMCGDSPMGFLLIYQAEDPFREVADVHHCYNGDRDHELEAIIGNVLSAVPDLVAACELLCKASIAGGRTFDDETLYGAYRMAQAAIKKARGE